ncbi:MAG: hypothetical protein HC802_03835 [Caldilineaceae bacterium]|nr:hypothetical protein [Caldilineaceae bacterium]
MGGKWNWQTGRVERLADSALHGVVEVDAIAGGNQFLLRASAVRSTGVPDERLFLASKNMSTVCVCAEIIVSGWTAI